jgi:hypothetical protein
MPKSISIPFSEGLSLTVRQALSALIYILAPSPNQTGDLDFAIDRRELRLPQRCQTLAPGTSPCL